MPPIVGVLVVAATSFAPSQSFANCTPAATGGNDIVSCNTPGTIADNYDALGGDDDITIENPVASPPLSQVAGTVSGGLGNDTFTFTSGLVHRIRGNGGDDILNMSGGATNQEINLDGGNNTATFTGGTVGAHVFSGTGTDTITVQGSALITGAVGTGAGSDLITMDGGSVGSIDGGDDVDTILLNAGTVTTRVDWGAGDESQVLNLSGLALVGNLRFGHGADVFELTDGQVNGFVELGRQGNDDLGGSNTFTLSGGTILGSIIAGDQGDTIVLNSGTVGSVLGGDGRTDRGTTGADTITLNGATINLDIDSGEGADQINIVSGSVRNILADQGADTITVSGGTITGRVRGQGGDDTIILSGGTVGGTVEGESGNDTISILDGFSTAGITIDGGADVGAEDDTIIVDTVAGRSLTGVINFENLRKDGTGILTFTGEQTYSTSTTITGGTLDVDGTFRSPSITMTTGGTTLNVGGLIEGLTAGSTTTLTGSSGSESVFVNSGGVLRVTGDLGDGFNQVTLAGTLDTGAGSLNVGADDDRLILNDGATITGLVDGGANSGLAAGDILFTNYTGDISLDGANVTNWEVLQKNGGGTLTLTGAHDYSTGTGLNNGMINVAGSLGTAVVQMADGTQLDVAGTGTVDNGAGAQTMLTGSASVNTVTVASGGTLRATGDLGDGADVLDVSGVLNAGAGGTLMLGAGDDRFIIRDGADVTGTVDGGAGDNTLDANISTTADLGAAQRFEILSKTGVGRLNINGPAASDFNTVNINAGTVNITATGAVNGVNSATVAAGAMLNIDGTLGFTPGADTLTVSGTVVSTINPLDLLDGDDLVTVNAGGDVTGDTVLGLGNDVFNLTGGVNTGDIYGDGMTASAADGNDTFNWSGGELNSGFFGGNGSDNATISGAAVYDGTEDFDGGDDVSAADGWVDTLTFDGITATAAAGTVRNWENVVIDSGVITFADRALTVGSETGLGLTLSNGGALNTSGGFTLTGNLINTGGVINSQDGNAGDRIRVSGDYTGGGQFRTDVDFTADTADVLEVAGDVVSGNTLIVVNDVSSGEASGNDVLVVEVGGTAAVDAFSSASVISGVWTYDLNQVGQNFYLNGTSAGLSPLATAYEVYPQTLKALNQLPTLQQRVGQRRWAVIEKNIVDADRDGVEDELDRCPNTAAKVVVDLQGCQKMLTETVSVELEVNFANGSSQLLEDASQEIAKLANFMQEHPDTSVVIEGHTSEVGSELYNQWLSDRRAEKIATQLREAYGISAERVAAIGYGESRLKVAETNSESAQKNRRVVAAISATQSVPATGERVDNPEWMSQQIAQQLRRHGLWMRVEGERRDQKAVSSTASTEYELARTLMQVGYDFPLANNQNGTWVGGITAHYTEADTDASSPTGNAGAESRGYGAGLTATWYGDNQAYADLQAQVSQYETDLSSELDPELADRLDGKGWILSIETGKRFSREGWGFTPQMQMTYGVISFDRFADNFGSNVSLQEDESLIGRLGIAIDRNRNWEKNGTERRHYLYGIMNLNYQFKDKTEVDVSGTSLVFEEDNWTTDLGVGGTYEWGDGQWALYGEASVQTGLDHFGDSNSIKGTIGIRGHF